MNASAWYRRAIERGHYRLSESQGAEILDSGRIAVVHEKDSDRYFEVPTSRLPDTLEWRSYSPRVSHRAAVAYTAVLSCLAAVAIVVFVRQNDLAVRELDGLGIAVVVGYGLIQIGLHESAHLVALHVFGRRAERIGFKMNFYVFPAFYVRMNQAHLLSRGERLVVHSAGLLVNCFLVGTVGVVSWVCDWPLLATANWIFCAGLMSNLTPLLNADGYKVILTLSNELEARKIRNKSRLILSLRIISLGVVMWYLWTLWQTVADLELF
jgi:putative peptide zinc metalloprotease protein